MISRANSDTADGRQSEIDSPQLVQPLSTPPSSISQPAGTKRKRSEVEAKDDEIEDVGPSKNPRRLERSKENLPNDPEADPKTSEQELLPSKDQLSEENLRALSKMNDNNTRPDSIERTSSWRSIVASSEVDSFRFQRSLNITAHYRYKHFEDANLYIHINPPEKIQAAIDDIVNAESSERRCAIFRDKAKTF